MLKKTNKLSLNFKILKFFFIPLILVYSPFFYNPQEVKAGLEFQWDQDDPNFRRLRWHQKDNRRSVRNQIYFFLRPNDIKTSLLKIDLILPETFKSTLKKKNISLCKVEIGGFEGRTKCTENIPADIEINNEESEESFYRRLTFYPYSSVSYGKDSYAVVLKVPNPRRSGLYQFHSYGQPAGKTTSRYLGSWTIVID